MLAFWLLLGLLVAGMVALVVLATGRNRTRGDELTRPDWFDQPHPSNRAARRHG